MIKSDFHMLVLWKIQAFLEALIGKLGYDFRRAQLGWIKNFANS
jgi:hypothetical protein